MLRYFWLLTTLRANPSQVPTASWFVTAIIVLNIVVSAVLSTVVSEAESLLRTVTVIVTQQTAICLLVWLALTMGNVANRFIPTITCWFGCDLLITALYGAVYPVLGMVSDTAPLTAIFVFFLWLLAACGYILHQALGSHFIVGLLSATAITLMASMISQTLVGT